MKSASSSDNILTRFSCNLPTLSRSFLLAEFLLLYNNSITGTLPDAVGDLTELLSLDYTSNFLNSTIPTSVGGLTALQALGIGSNEHTGTIPTEIGQLVNLASLIMEENALSGVLPTQLGNLASLGMSAKRTCLLLFIRCKL